MKILCIKTKPSDSKQKDYHLLLADYLYKEFKSQNINVTKNNVILKVKLNSKTNDGHDQIVIDCFEGKMYLRGKEIKDKNFGKLRRFSNGKPGEAYDCAVQSAKRIINRIKKLENLLKEDVVFKTEVANDLRKKAESYQAFSYKKNALEIFKNPTAHEIEQIVEQDEYRSIRGVIYEDGTIYCWPGSILHAEINDFLENKIDVDSNSAFRFAYEKFQGWVFDLNYNYTVEEAKEKIYKYKDILSNFGNFKELEESEDELNESLFSKKCATKMVK